MNLGLGFHYNDTTAFIFKYRIRSGESVDNISYLYRKITFFTHNYMVATQHWLGDRFWIQYGLAVTDLDISADSYFNLTDTEGNRILAELPLVPIGFSVYAAVGFEFWRYQNPQADNQQSFFKRLFANQLSAHIELAANSALFQANRPEQNIHLNDISLNVLFRF